MKLTTNLLLFTLRCQFCETCFLKNVTNLFLERPKLFLNKMEFFERTIPGIFFVISIFSKQEIVSLSNYCWLDSSNNQSFCQFKIVNVWFLYISKHLTEKNVDFSEIRTRMVSVEDEHLDHLTTTATNPPDTFTWTCFSVNLTFMLVWDEY